MKIEKSNLSKAVSKLKTVVPKLTAAMALQGILVKDGYFTANNMDMAIRTKIAGADESSEAFIIPSKAFELIANLPDGEVELIPAGGDGVFSLTIKTGKIKNTYQTFDPDSFALPNMLGNEDKEFTIASDRLVTSMRRVLYAIPTDAKQAMQGCMSLRTDDSGMLNFAGLDGHILAWDKIKVDGEINILLPKLAAEKLLTAGISGDCRIRFNKFGIIIHTDAFELFTRTVEGEYYNFTSLLAPLPYSTVVDRSKLLDAVTRAKMCATNRTVRLSFSKSEVVIKIKDSTTDYTEIVELDTEIDSPVNIAFDAVLLIETLKASDSDMIALNLESGKKPMIVEADNSDLKQVVLPLAIPDTE